MQVSNDNKEEYKEFCERHYVQIYSKPWWMDAVCGPENWDVWLYKKGNEVQAAMPYYKEKRGKYNYITKAPLTQINGIIFSYPNNGNLKECTKQDYEERVINAANEFIRESGVDVYEQQYQYDFSYWLPFFWHGYSAITRVTYVIDNTSNVENLWNNISYKYRNSIKKGQKNGKLGIGLTKEEFYIEHEKVFKKQGLSCPFSYDLWCSLFDACNEHNSCKILYEKNVQGKISSLLFLVWDEKSMYHLLGGNIPEFQTLETYNALTWEAIKLASNMGKKYDFEGSVIKRISKSFREFGGEPKRYYRIRKIFNEDIIKMECEQQIEKLKQESIKYK